MSSNPLPWILLGAGVLGVGGVLLYSKKASAAAIPASKVQAKIAMTNDPKVLNQLAAGLQQAGNTKQALDALQKAADITGTVQQVPGAASLPTITVTPSSGAMSAASPGGSPTSYVVANGDYPGAIAKRFGTTLGALANANGAKKARVAGGMIRANEILALPLGVSDRGPGSHAMGTAS